MSQDKCKVLWFGDLVNPSGFGRIGNEVCRRLVMRGWPVVGASIPWQGYPWNPLPFPVVGFGGVDIWARLSALVASEQPEVVVVCQDFPYAQTAFQGCRIDWSQRGFMVVTPIDGTPIHPAWLDVVDLADSTLVISEFGVEGMRLAGRQVSLLPPGVDCGEFYPAAGGEVAALRQKVGLPPDTFVVGMFAMNQGRKAVSATADVFREFARDKPDAFLYLDMDKGSPAGWDIPVLCEQIRLDPTKVKYKQDAMEAGLMGLRERYLLCDVNSVISHREGFGLPLIEAQACGVVAMALDYCSGPEVVGGGKGVLVRRIPYMEYGTWGHARDAFPDMRDWLHKLNQLYHKPALRQQLANAGYEAAKARTWDKTADRFEDELKKVAAKRQEKRANEPVASYVIPAPGYSDDGGDGQHHRADLQQPGGGVSVSVQSGGNHQPGHNGNTGAGRRQPGLQPAGAAPDAGDQAGAE